ncbi:MAG: hypothetical protein DWQ45_08040 [Planctomycetota bacterium]|nr:MAG: hypothetical protein DWQ41_11230 [Planctomycetota bacterium]REK37162.1 MAG: hypothetical protein DWQ45_08040 [Planctomycetota bacterium]
MPLDAAFVGDDEFIYRRIPVSTGWYDPAAAEPASPRAFQPHPENDPEGLSVSRAKSEEHPDFPSLGEASLGPSRHGYFVAVLRVGDLRQRGIDVVADPLEENPGHALIPDLTSGNRNSAGTWELMSILADELTLRVEGPFHVADESPTD